jgi:hypothetical protein
LILAIGKQTVSYVSSARIIVGSELLISEVEIGSRLWIWQAVEELIRNISQKVETESSEYDCRGLTEQLALHELISSSLLFGP